ncbi:hypothetical protein EV426DRAFT_704396 [Tirmania nivea]|nr:hypothetical protein EV426DRAFT_704396 [Tirmania nivea]
MDLGIGSQGDMERSKDEDGGIGSDSHNGEIEEVRGLETTGSTLSARLTPLNASIATTPRRTATTSPSTAIGDARTLEELDTPMWRKEKGEKEEWDAVEAFFAYLYRSLAGR